jgi:cell division protein FtsB
MTDNTELKRLAEAANAVTGDASVDITISSEPGPNQAEIDAVTAFIGAATPAAVLALIAENDALAGLLKRFVDGEHEQDENQAERHMYFTEAQSILALVNGELEAHTIVPDSAIKAIHAERDQLRAEVAGLRTGYEAYERVNAELRAEVEKFREVMACVVNEASRQTSRNGNAPGHCHSIPGVWDRDNGAKAGTECGWCKVWNAALDMSKEPTSD